MDNIIGALEERIKEIEADMKVSLVVAFDTRDDFVTMHGEIKGLKQAIQIVKDKGADYNVIK